MLNALSLCSVRTGLSHGLSALACTPAWITEGRNDAMHLHGPPANRNVVSRTGATVNRLEGPRVGRCRRSNLSSSKPLLVGAISSCHTMHNRL
eukprot:925351-Amphidinium_carterae.2